MSFPLSVLHLSDLRIGPHGRFAGGGEPGGRLARAAERARKELGFPAPVSLVVVTGDITESGRRAEFEDALAFFESAAAALSLDRRRFVFVPGDHDVSWAETRKITIEQEDEGFDDVELERRLAAARLGRFEAFASAFAGGERRRIPHVHALACGGYVHAFPELGLAVAALNSCERESHLRQGGHLGEAQAQALLDYFRGAPEPWLRLIAVHHAATFEGSERLRAVAEDARAQIILHGHHQEGAGSHAWTFRRGNKGHTLVLSPAEPAMIHMLCVDPARREVRSAHQAYEPRFRPEGEVKPGDFTQDPAEPKAAVLDLTPPDHFQAQTAPAAAAFVEDIDSFVQAYRRRFAARFVRWELAGVGVPPASGASRPLEARLDDMYLPPRLGTDEGDKGSSLGPEVILTRARPLVIRGPAGSGKTTFMRWTFRRLIAMDEVIPLFIELRELAFVWDRDAGKGQERTIEGYLCARLAEVRGQDERAMLGAILGAGSGLLPVLLVDGWDELGDLGHRARERLMEFLSAHPRVIAVVTSRPHGESRPSAVEGFEVLDLLPLSDAEIEAFTQQYYLFAHGEDERAAQASASLFLSALFASAEAQALARTPLLLTMMLLVGRARPLSDKRHELYHVCLENLLAARPRWREAEGARLGAYQWRPDDSAERMRAAAALAYRVQREGYREESRGTIVRTEEELCRMLPERFTQDERKGFLAWLVGAAGVLADRSDDTLSFTHLSFQEYLAAHHLAATVEGDEARAALCRAHAGDLGWWETLRLWAAIVFDRNPEHLKPVLLSLLDSSAPAFWLLGAMLADGLGEGVFEAWRERLGDRFHVDEQVESYAAARAWAASRREDRRRRLALSWTTTVSKLHWFGVVLCEQWWAEARLSVPTREHVFSRLVREAGDGQGIGRGRALGGASPVWPGEPTTLVPLHLWPGPRRQAAARLQTLISLGGKRDHVVRAAPRMLVPEAEERALARLMARSLARTWARESGHGWVRDWAMDLARDWALDLSRYWARSFARDWALDLARYQARYLARYWTRELARDWALDLSRYWARDRGDWVLDLARSWAQELALPEEIWTLDFAAVELASVGRAGTRAVLAFSEPNTPELRLFSAACRLSLRPHSDGEAFRRALAELPLGLDPIWLALARHIARVSTREERALLVDLARHPERRPAPLSWGLKYYVRGDLVFEDGTEMTLDELCDEAKIERLPYLEDVPDEIVAEFDQEAPAC